MKIAISDFDGTLCRIAPGTNLGGRVPEENVVAIRRWREAGNKFGIASGRGLSFLVPEVEKYGIPVDFLICGNGSSVFDGERNRLHRTVIPTEVLEAFARHPLSTPEDRPFLVFGERQLYSVRPYPHIPVEVAPLISIEEAVKREDVVQLGLMFPTPEETRQASDEMERDFPMLGGNPNRVYLDINMNQVNKRYGVERLLEVMGWEGNEVFVIGDDRNDLPMIHHFHGFTVNTAQSFVKEAATRIYDSVGNMLNENL